jgi:hypothetical protein
LLLLLSVPTDTVDPPAPNSPPAILQRIQSGRVTWTRPLAFTAARTALILLVQSLLAGPFFLRGHADSWRAQAPWWTVYAVLIDLVCLLLLRRQTHREGIRLRDLLAIDRSRLPRELLWGLLYLALLFPIVAAGSKLAG